MRLSRREMRSAHEAARKVRIGKRFAVGAWASGDNHHLAGTICGVVKTTVYLDESDAAALRRLADATGRSQAELMREAIAEKARSAGPRDLGFIAAGHGSGEPVGRHADGIVRGELGRSHP
jgi:hypothetical protein